MGGVPVFATRYRRLIQAHDSTSVGGSFASGAYMSSLFSSISVTRWAAITLGVAVAMPAFALAGAGSGSPPASANGFAFGHDHPPSLECAGAHGFELAELVAAAKARLKSGSVHTKSDSNRLFQVVYLDDPGTGFLDPAPAAPLPGNPATTLGEQRQAVLQAALDIWAMRIDSVVSLRVGAFFEDLDCFAGMGGPFRWAEGIATMPLADAPYPAPLIAARTGQRVSGQSPELLVRFNANLERPCYQAIVPDGFWYGLDRYQPSPTTFLPFLEIALHEIGHGLGFVGIVGDDGTVPTGFSGLDIFSRQFYSASQQQPFTALSAQQRAASLALPGDLLWDGAAVKQRLDEVLGPPREVRAIVGGQARSWPASSHEFVPIRPAPGLDARLHAARNNVLAPSTDAVARSPRDACEALLDAPLPPGSALLAEVGGCDYDTKWRHAYLAGAEALLVMDSREPDDPRSAARIGVALNARQPLPLWTLGPSAGAALWPLAADNTAVELGFVADVAPNGTRDGRMPMLDPGHFGRSTDQRLVMSTRSWGAGRFGFTDLTADALYDIGWSRPDARRSLYVGAWYQPARSGEGCLLSPEGDEGLFALSCYFHHQGEQIWTLGVAELRGEALDFAPVQITRGTGYGSSFDPAQVVREPFGRIRLSLSDCNHGVLDVWPEQPGFEPFQVPLKKIIPGDCQRLSADLPEQDRSGSYYDPARSGEGIQIAVEGASGLASLAWYTYRDGAQLWAIGAGSLQGESLSVSNAVLANGTGFGREFDPEDVQRTPFGEFELRWLDCNRVEVGIRPTVPGLEATQRTLQRVVPREC
jgi:hypothetical protein